MICLLNFVQNFHFDNRCLFQVKSTIKFSNMNSQILLVSNIQNKLPVFKIKANNRLDKVLLYKQSDDGYLEEIFVLNLKADKNIWYVIKLNDFVPIYAQLINHQNCVQIIPLAVTDFDLYFVYLYKTNVYFINCEHDSIILSIDLEDRQINCADLTYFANVKDTNYVIFVSSSNQLIYFKPIKNDCKILAINCDVNDANNLKLINNLIFGLESGRLDVFDFNQSIKDHCLVKKDSFENVCSYVYNHNYFMLFDTPQSFVLYNIHSTKKSVKYMINFDFNPLIEVFLNRSNLTMLSIDRKRLVTFLINDKTTENQGSNPENDLKALRIINGRKKSLNMVVERVIIEKYEENFLENNLSIDNEKKSKLVKIEPFKSRNQINWLLNLVDRHGVVFKPQKCNLKQQLETAI